jgi:hypothetical protein
MLVLKHLFDWSFDECEREVRGSLVDRPFCRIDGERIPDAKTLIRLSHCLVSVADPMALQRIAARFDARLVEQIARRSGVGARPPDPRERAAGYPCRLSIYQAEFSKNLVFRRTQVLNRVYEQLLRDHLLLGRPDLLKVVFDRQIRTTTPGGSRRRSCVAARPAWCSVSRFASTTPGTLEWARAWRTWTTWASSRITPSRASRRRKRWPCRPPWTARPSSGWSLSPSTEGSASPLSASARLGR